MAFTGSVTGTMQLRVAESGALHFEGDQGSLLTITDDLSDSLFSVNDAAGMPVFEVFADDTIKSYRNNETKLEIDPDNNRVRLRDNAYVSGNMTTSGNVYFEGESYGGPIMVGTDSSDIAGLNTATLCLQDANEGGTIQFWRSDTFNGVGVADSVASSAGLLGDIRFGNRNYEDEVAGIRAYVHSTAASAAEYGAFLSFYTEEASAPYLLERMRIASDGKVYLSSDLIVSGDITASTATHTSTSYVASTHVSGLSGYYGKVGIGTQAMGGKCRLMVSDGTPGSDPSNGLLVLHGSEATAFDGAATQAAGEGTTLQIWNNSTSLGSYSAIQLAQAGSAAYGYARIACVSPANDTAELAFTVESAGTYKEAMRLNKLGRVGIGLQSPTTELHVSGTLPVITLSSANSQARIDFRDAAVGQATIGVNPTHSDAFCIAVSSAGSVSLTNDAKLIVATDGKVQISPDHNVNPQALLTVSGDASITGELRTDGNVGINVAPAGTFHAVGSAGTTAMMVVGDIHSNPIARFYKTSSATAMVVSGDGKVVVGGEDPGKLDGRIRTKACRIIPNL